ncbi:MAG: hypothetical protein WC858_00395 [Parcubacteria group bacterium]|jgi:hypothetical protein
MIFDILKLIVVFPIILVLPGIFFMLAAFGRSNAKISFFERAVLTVPFSIIIIDLICFILNRFDIPIKGVILLGSIIIFCLIGFIAYQYRFKSRGEKNKEADLQPDNLFNFSNWQTIFILLSIFVAVFIRVAYLSDTIVPSATDLGHHMYWSQTIIDSGKLPVYGMPDFIIGEHIIFAAVNLLSGVGLMTAMPTLLLLFVNIAGIFTLVILAARLFKNKNITAVMFLVAGVLYAINAPQGKYVSGGVVGNIIGDMLIPVVLYFLYRALAEKDSFFGGLFLFSLIGILYTHHLSSFILLFSIAGIIFFYLAVNFRGIFNIILAWIKIFARPFPIAVLLIALIFFIFVFMPSYFNPSAVSQATGAPTKITRVGLNLNQIEMNAGSGRLILGALGMLLIAVLAWKPKKYWISFAAGWVIISLVMAYKPNLLLINIPSDRVGNYLFLPFSILSAYALVKYFELFRKSASKFFASVLLYALMFFIITNGLSDSADAFKSKNQFQEIMETYHSAEFLSKNVDTSKDIILKDHINIAGDSFYKLFFMKDYKYPLSRGNLSRYVDPTKPREICTRDIIDDPENDTGKACLSDTGVDYVVLNAQLEGMSFEKYPSFSKVYASNYISVFKKN